MTNYENASLAELRTQMQIAQALVKNHVSFVVMPVKTRDDYVRACLTAAERLDELENMVEEQVADLTNETKS